MMLENIRQCIKLAFEASALVGLWLLMYGIFKQIRKN